MLSGISIWSLLLILAIALVLFGSKRLRSLGSDLGEAIRGFRRSVRDPDPEQADSRDGVDADGSTPETGPAEGPAASPEQRREEAPGKKPDQPA